MGDILAHSSNVGIPTSRTCSAGAAQRLPYALRLRRPTGSGSPARRPAPPSGPVVGHARDDPVRPGYRGHAAADGGRLRDDRERREVGAAAASCGEPSARTATPVRAGLATRRVRHDTADRHGDARLCRRGRTGGRRRSPATRSPARPGRARSRRAASTSRYMASFMGFLPASHPGSSSPRPRRAGTVYGGVAAAPLFQDVARFALDRLGIAPAPRLPIPPHAITPG